MNFYHVYSRQLQQAVETCRAMAARGYAPAEGGNLAQRLQEDLILITPTRLNKGLVTADDLVFIDSRGRVLAGERSPTGETPLYLELFSQRPDACSVLHAHPPAIGALAISDAADLLSRPFFPETVIDCGPAPLVPYAEPLTERLARSFRPFLERSNCFIMQNHGALVLTNGGLAEAFGRLELLENTADSLLRTLAAGLQPREISRREVLALENTMRSRRLCFPGLPGLVSGLEELYYQPGPQPETPARQQ